MTDPKKIEELVKELTDEEMEIIKTEDKRRQQERDKAIQEREDYVRFKAFAICNKCRRALTREMVERNPTCPFCGSEAATPIEHEEKPK